MIWPLAASLVMRQAMPSLTLGTLLAGIVTSTVSWSVFWMVATAPVHTEPTVAFSEVMVPSMVAVRVQLFSVSRSVSSVLGVRADWLSRVAASSTFWARVLREE